MIHARSGPVDPEPDTSVRPPLVRELFLVAGLFLVYKLGRLAANGHVEEAFRNAGHVWDLERVLHLPDEGAVQGLLLHGHTLVQAANTYYATVHFPATLVFLVWLYLRRPRHYVWSRRVLAVLTGAALALHLLFPLAPPRMLPAADLVDTGRVYGPSVYGDTPADDSLANQFAAMPSLHFGWALAVAVGLVVATRSRWRLLWLLHPLVTLLVIVGTANHYWLDAIVVTVLLSVAYAALRPPARTHRPRRAPAGQAAPPATIPAPGAYASGTGTQVSGTGAFEAGTGMCASGTGVSGTGAYGAGTGAYGAGERTTRARLPGIRTRRTPELPARAPRAHARSGVRR
ncbi:MULTISPECIES: phosphatase PAP2 family protein [unclassified Streptomyces]|uniref:phosphatase PAP2 family protein n=1 Tax=unclassified Streptomyces TaxID=2593676 RepID=UPI0004905DD8|nr:phosphatase PAP2 family protein [Streptomyces sp. DpondAA-D4]SCD82492.1 PAP2 superfamily protein [Streptomyces sp. DpondAA-D4]